MAKKAAKKSGKTLGKKAMKKTRGGLTLNGAIGGSGITGNTRQVGGGTLISGNVNGDGKIMLNGGSFTGSL